MKIEKIHVTNFCMLRDLDVNLEDGLSLIIGRNNCGKTSFLTVLDRFLGSQSASNHFTYEDFNCNFQNDLFDLVQGKTSWGNLGKKGIELVLYISYDENDDLEPIHGLLMDLDEQNHHVVLRFAYAISEDRVPDLIHDFEEFHKRAADAGEAAQAEFDVFMKNRHKAFFKVARYAVLYDTQTKTASETVYHTLGKGDPDLSRVICFRSIGARRNTVNREGDSSLSSLSARYYEQLSHGTSNSAVQELDHQLLTTDKELSDTYESGAYFDVIHQTAFQIKRLEDKTRLRRNMEELKDAMNGTIGEVIDCADRNRLCIWDDKQLWYQIPFLFLFLPSVSNKASSLCTPGASVVLSFLAIEELLSCAAKSDDPKSLITSLQKKA